MPGLQHGPCHRRSAVPKRRLTGRGAFPDAVVRNGPGRSSPARRSASVIAPQLVTSTKTLGYRELDELSHRVASALRARGLRPGQVVSLYAQNRWEWVVSYHGA